MIESRRIDARDSAASRSPVDFNRLKRLGVWQSGPSRQKNRRRLRLRWPGICARDAKSVCCGFIA